MPVCPRCGDEVRLPKPGKYWGYCSFECSHAVFEPQRLAKEAANYAARGIERLTVPCEYCGREFERWASRPKKYCSDKCGQAATRQAARQRKQAGTAAHAKEARRKKKEAGKKSALGRWTILNRDDFACFYCGIRSYEGARLHLDHVQARCNGGQDVAGNLVACCESCNCEKHTSYVLDVDNILAEIRQRNKRAGLRDDQRITLPQRPA